MALTTQQMISLGFKPSKRSSMYDRKYDTLIYPINTTDYLYIGYNEFTKRINNKILWKSFKQIESGERITYPVVHLGETGFKELKDFLDYFKRDIYQYITDGEDIADINTEATDKRNELSVNGNFDESKVVLINTISPLDLGESIKVTDTIDE